MGSIIGINDFISNFTGGGARNNLYKATITSPFFTNQKATYMCKGAEMPSSNLGTAQCFYMGRQIKVVGDRTFPPVTFTFYEDTDYSVRKDFEKWMSAMNKHEANTGEPKPRNYYGEIILEQLDREGGGSLYTYTLKDCFPTEVGSISLGYDQNDSIVEFPVTFEMNYWTSDGADN